MGCDTVWSGNYHRRGGYAVGFFEQLVNCCGTTWYHISEESNFIFVKKLLFACLLLLCVDNRNLVEAFYPFRTK